MKYGLQLYSVHTAMKKDVKQTLVALAEMGYKTVEPCGFFDSTPEQFRAWCDELGLEIPAVHYNSDLATDEKFNEMVNTLKTLRCDKMVIPCKVCKTKAEMDALVEFINKNQPKMAEHGIKLVYHNHSHEFRLTPDDFFMHTELQKRTNVDFEIDVYWCHYAGVNPVYVMEHLKDRVALVHFRDGFANGHEDCQVLGKGDTPLNDVYNWIVKNNVPLIVENLPTEVLETEMDEALQCIDYLKTL